MDIFNQAEIESLFYEWWGLSFKVAPGIHAINTHVEFGQWLCEKLAKRYAPKVDGNFKPMESVELYTLLRDMKAGTMVDLNQPGHLRFLGKDGNHIATIACEFSTIDEGE